MTLLACGRETGETVGLARLAREDDPLVAEWPPSGNTGEQLPGMAGDLLVFLRGEDTHRANGEPGQSIAESRRGPSRHVRRCRR